MSFTKTLVVRPGSKVHLAKIDPGFSDGFESEDDLQENVAKYHQRLRDLQYHLYAENKQSLLICLQGMDAAGKDGTVKSVMDIMHPLGTFVHSFKVPSQEEAAHDFLWRVHKQAPAKGELKLFNRSHYEDVLVTRVHGLVPKSVWSERYELINDFEKLLRANGTRILKFYLHISPEEQLKRFAQRLEDPSRRWKISETDYSDRKLWPKYLEAYEECLSKTSTKHAPWFIIPADKKWFRDYAVCKIIKHALQEMDPQLPKPTVDIAKIREEFQSATRAAKKAQKQPRK